MFWVKTLRFLDGGVSICQNGGGGKVRAKGGRLIKGKNKYKEKCTSGREHRGSGGEVLVHSHGIHSIQIPRDIFPFADDGGHRGMEAVVILRGESKDCDVGVVLRGFVVLD